LNVRGSTVVISNREPVSNSVYPTDGKIEY